MQFFKRGHDFIDFSQSVRVEHRYVFSSGVHEFLNNLAATSTSRVRSLPYDHGLWRAQLGCDSMPMETVSSDLTVVWDDDVPYGPERMKPLSHAAREGRVNAKGIPCLYLATDQETAMAELRPWLEAQISLARFRTTKDLKVIDCSVNHDSRLTPDTLFKAEPPEEVTDAVWTMVDRAFAKPVTDDVSTAEYVPTQIIADLFSQHGLDGLQYKSTVGPGFNIALFDLDSADVTDTFLFRAKSVSYEFRAEKYTSVEMKV